MFWNRRKDEQRVVVDQSNATIGIGYVKNLNVSQIASTINNGVEFDDDLPETTGTGQNIAIVSFEDFDIDLDDVFD